jgi:hypothetical protein
MAMKACITDEAFYNQSNLPIKTTCQSGHIKRSLHGPVITAGYDCYNGHIPQMGETQLLHFLRLFSDAVSTPCHITLTGMRRKS